MPAPSSIRWPSHSTRTSSSITWSVPPHPMHAASSARLRARTHTHARTLSRSHLRWQMIEELGLEIPDDPWGPAKDGIVTLISFIVFGSVPLWVYVILFGAKYANEDGVFGIACAATVITLFALG